MKIFGLQIGRDREARSLENPRKSINEGVDELLMSGSSSGANVSEQSALTLTAVWCAVRVLAESVGSLPLVVYERTADGGRKPATNHPVYPLLHDEPNSMMTSLVWRETVQAHCVTWGNGYSFIKYRSDGRPSEILPLFPDRTQCKVENGRQVYITKINGKDYKLDAMDILHVPGLGWDGLQGYSPIRMQRESIGLGMAATEFGARFFGNGATPSGVLEHPEKLSKEAAERLRAEWTRIYSGTGNSHKTAVLQEGLKYNRISLPPEDAQFIETRKFQTTDIARIFRVPPHMLGDLERATFSNIEHQGLEFVVHTLRPWLVRWEQELNRKLFLPSERGRFFVEFKVDGLLRGDIQARYNAYAVGRNWGWLSINDIRRLENMNPITNGEDYLQPLNMTIAGDTSSQANSQARSRLSGLEGAAVERIAASEGAAIARAQNKEGFDEWAEEYLTKQAERVAKDLQLPLETVLLATRTALSELPKHASHWETWRAEQLRGLVNGY